MKEQFLQESFQISVETSGRCKIKAAESNKGGVEEHLRQVHSDPRREDSLEEMEKLIKATEPAIPFRAEEPSWQEVNTSGRSEQNKPQGRMAFCTRCIKIVKGSKEDFLADSWLVTEGCFIAKEENSTGIKQFCTISLLNIEGKIFLGILAKRLTTFTMDNGYMDTSVQNGGVPGVAGCLEHISIITKVIEDVKKNRGDLAVLWLDLTNAYVRYHINWWI